MRTKILLALSIVAAGLCAIAAYLHWGYDPEPQWHVVRPTNGERVKATVNNQRDYTAPSQWAEGGTNAWFSGAWRMQLQDEHGQVYFLNQLRSNSNLYVVYQSQGDTNGITNSFGYRMGWFQKGNWWVKEDATVIEVQPIHFE